MLAAHCATSARAQTPHTAHPAPRTTHATPFPRNSHTPLLLQSPHTTAGPTYPPPALPLKAGCPQLSSTCHPQGPHSPSRPGPFTPGPASCPSARPRPGPLSAAPEARRVLQALLEVHGHLHGGGRAPLPPLLRLLAVVSRRARGEARPGQGRQAGGAGVVLGAGTGAPCARPARARLTARAASSDRPRERGALRPITPREGWAQ